MNEGTKRNTIQIGMQVKIVLKKDQGSGHLTEGVVKAILKTQAYLKENNLDLKIIVEARSLTEIEEILSVGGVHRILIDNFDYETTKKAVQLIGNQCQTESSGGINLETARNYAECGVDYISSGALTHSVYNMDLSLKAV